MKKKIDKWDTRIAKIKEWVDEQYKAGRTSIIGNDELELLVDKMLPDISQKKEERAS